MAGALKPSPTFICQRTLGPSLGQLRLRDEAERPFRAGPRNWGQSSARAESAIDRRSMAVRKRIRYLSSVASQQYVSQLLGVIEKGTLSAEGFDDLALQLFALQVEHNAAYRSLGAGRKEVRSWEEIPAVPTAGFKELELTSIAPGERIKEFRSSGTTGQKPSRHFHSADSLRVYEASLGPPLRQHFMRDRMTVVSLTPSPNDAPHSSLVHMFSAAGAVFAGREDWSVNCERIRLHTAAATGGIGLVGTAFNFVHLIDAGGAL